MLVVFKVLFFDYYTAYRSLLLEGNMGWYFSIIYVILKSILIHAVFALFYPIFYS